MSVVLSVALLFVSPVAPANPTPGVEGVPAARVSVPARPYLAPEMWTDTALSLTFDGPPPTTTLAPEPPLVLTAIEQGMGHLAELGATTYQLRVFGCLAWFESRNDPYAVSPTNDHGLWQINRRFHAWRWAGRDIYDPTVNAGIAWDIYRESGWRAWSTHSLCGV